MYYYICNTIYSKNFPVLFLVSVKLYKLFNLVLLFQRPPPSLSFTRSLSLTAAVSKISSTLLPLA